MNEDITNDGRQTLTALKAMMAEAPPEVIFELARVRASLDGYAAQLREAGWSQGQVGALIMDAMIGQGLERKIAILVAMECLK